VSRSIVRRKSGGAIAPGTYGSFAYICSVTIKMPITNIFLVATMCNHGDVCLVGGYTDYEGRVEVCVSGYWGHICFNGWDTTGAMVVCKQLFGEDICKSSVLTANSSSSPSINIHFPIQWQLHSILVYLRIMLYSITCSGSPSRLVGCSYSLVQG